MAYIFFRSTANLKLSIGDVFSFFLVQSGHDYIDKGL